MIAATTKYLSEIEHRLRSSAELAPSESLAGALFYPKMRSKEVVADRKTGW